MTKKNEPLEKAGLVTALSVGAVAGLVSLGPLHPDNAPRELPGPFLADVVEVIDSDTIKLRVHTWLDQSIIVRLRLYGIDTPEKFRPKCDKEKFLAIDATHFVRARLLPSERVEVTDVTFGKFARRAVGVLTYDHEGKPENLNDALIRADHAVAYFGETKVKDWCAE